MGKNFFDFVKDSFFNPFSNNGNYKLNYDLLALINSKMSLNNLQVTKDEIADWIIDYLENSPIDFYSDDDNHEITDISGFSYDKIRYFVKCGWLVEDFEGIRITYQMDEIGIQILETMANVIKEETKTLEFSGFVYSIYSNLMHFQYDHAVDTIEQVYETSMKLNSMLRGLNVNIKKFLTKLVSENKAQPKEILNTIFYEYQRKVVLKAFRNFREVDNPSKYKNKILSKIEDLSQRKNLEKIIDRYIEVKYSKINSPENREEARESIEEAFNYIRDQFEEIEDYIAMLDRKNTNYITTANSRLNFLLNEETDIEGRIIEALKGIKDVDEDFFSESPFDLFTNGNLDEYSLYTPITRKPKIKSSQILKAADYSQEEIDSIFEEMLKENDYSVSKINEFVLENLKGKSSLPASQFHIESIDDLMKLLLAFIYSENSNVEYEARMMDQTFSCFDYEMNDFLVKGRK